MSDNFAARDPGSANRANLLNQLGAFLRVGGVAAAGLSLATVRASLPMLEMLTGLRASTVEGGDQPGAFGFSRGEIAVLTRLATKVTLESIEIASVTDPVYEGAPAYVARIDGEWQEPHLVHLLALGLAVNRLWGGEDDKTDEADDQTPPPAADKTVVFLSVAPGEFVAPGPMQPTEIRRMAMRQRVLNQPEPAMLLRGSDPATLVAASRAAPAVAAGYGWPHSARIAPEMMAQPAMARRPSCGCGRPGCEYCEKNHSFAPARVDKDGDCEPWFSISCDTRSRIRECFKIAFCDMLRCLGDEICDENCRFAENPDVMRCLESFVCSLLGCLPDAICPPNKPEPTYCLPAPCAPDCRRNFAVGD